MNLRPLAPILALIVGLALTSAVAYSEDKTVPTADFASVSAILAQNCAGCHLWAATPEGIRRNVVAGEPDSSPIVVMIETGQMPPGGGLSENEKSLIYDWIKAGALMPEGQVSAPGSAKASSSTPSAGALPPSPFPRSPVQAHMISGFLSTGLLLAAGAVGTWRLVDLMSRGHNYRDSIGFPEEGASPAQEALRTQEISSLWYDPQGQTIRWLHVGLLSAGSTLYLYNAVTGISFLSPQGSTMTKRDLHRYAFFVHVGMMGTQVALGILTTDALRRGDHALVSTLGPIHAVLGVATPLVIGGSGLLMAIRL